MDDTTSLTNKVIESAFQPPRWLVVLPLVAIAAFLLLGAFFETLAERDRLMASAMKPEHFVIDDPSNGPFCLYVAHPRKLLLGQPTEVMAPIAVALTPPTSIDPQTSTNTVTISYDYKIQCEDKSKDVTVGQPLTRNTGLATYAVTLKVGQSLTIVGGNDNLPSPKALYDLDFSVSPSGSMQILHVRQAVPTIWRSTTEQVNITVADRKNGRLIGSATLNIQQEPLISAFVRSVFVGFRSDSIYIAIALLPSYGAIVTAVFFSQRAKRRKIQQNRERIDQLRKLLDQNSASFIGEFLEVSQLVANKEGRSEKSTGYWASAEVRNYFSEKVRNALSPEYQTFIRMFNNYEQSKEQPEESRSILAREDHEISPDHAAQAIEWAIWSGKLNKSFQLIALEMIDKAGKQLVTGDRLEALRHFITDGEWPTYLRSWTSLSVSAQIYPTFRLNSQVYLNVFASSRAERDKFLFPPGRLKAGQVTHRIWQQVKQKPQQFNDLLRHVAASEIVFVEGPAGSGKTATALILSREFVAKSMEGQGGLARREGVVRLADNLPVYWQCDRSNDSVSSLLDIFARAYSQTLLAYVSLAPYKFFESSQLQQRAIAHLFRYCFQTGDRMRLWSARLHPSEQSRRVYELDPLASMIDAIEYHEHSTKGIEIEWLLTVLYHSIPEAVEARLAIVDIQADGEQTSGSRFQESILELLEQLSDLKIAATVFTRPGIFTPSAAQKQITLRWNQGDDDDMAMMFKNRLLLLDHFRDGNLSVLCDPREMNVEEATSAIVKASDGNPGRLIDIGNLLVSAAAKRGQRLQYEDMNDILEAIRQIPK